ncbi:MAG TPA: M48 family metallopeptidase [Pyrinomonadaceae bacterium]|nr:M48 family metallopeptidase [Pyrinomonadaceae bacterium]
MALLCVLLGQAACGGLFLTGGLRGPRYSGGFNLFSPEQDIELGKASAAEAAREARPISDERVAAYVRRVGARLAAHAPGYEFPYQFTVVDAPEVNAFAFPGGYVFINAGAVAAAQSEGELAAILAHEISHVALRHGTRQASKAYLAKAGMHILDSLTGGRESELGRLLAALGGAGADMVFNELGRTSETEADLEGARLMAAAGYDPREMARFFEKLGESGGWRAPQTPSDHPDPGSRVAAINQSLSALPALRLAKRNPEEFRQIRKRLRGY